MKTLRGRVTKIKIVSYGKMPLIRFTMNDEVNCLIAKHSLNFLYEVQEDSSIVLGGDCNSRGQFVVSRYCVLNKEDTHESWRFISRTEH